MLLLTQLLDQSASRHNHLCPRQVLGMRMALLAIRMLELDSKDGFKRLLTISETDGCAADGLSIATECTVGNRRLRILDFGKVAATFVGLDCDYSIRISPARNIRSAALEWAPQSKNRWHAQLQAYQIMPDEELLVVQWVKLSISLEKLLSKPGYRVNCQMCGEEIINQREVLQSEMILCQACAGQSYYQLCEINAAALQATSSHRPRKSWRLRSQPIEN